MRIAATCFLPLWGMLILLVGRGYAAGPVRLDSASVGVEQDAAYTAGSESFLVRSFDGGPAATDVLNACESLRRALRELWLGANATTDWRPRCQVIVYSTRAAYLGAVGRGAGQTSGSSLVRFDGGRATERRIDLLAGDHGQLSALAHELTHVVLADRFGGRLPPRWLDEGVATLADSVAKQSLHRRDCLDALRTGAALRLTELFYLERFRSADQVPTFYGQSASLVRFLADRDDPERVIVFVERALDHGYDRALRDVYQIHDVSQLERMWHQFATRHVEIAQVVTAR